MTSDETPSKRGRKATAVDHPALPAIADDNAKAMLDTAEELGAGLNMVLGYEEPLRQLGQLEAFEFTKRVSDVATAQIFENLKNTKAYVGLPYVDTDGKTKRISTIEELCEVKFGKTARRMLDLSHNLRLLGPDLYEQSEKLGLRNIDYKALRALPEDDQALVKKAIEETGSREEVIDLLQKMAARHHGEKKALTQQVEEAKQESAAKDAVNQQKTQKIEELVEKINRRDGMTEAEKLIDMERALQESTLLAIGHMAVVRQRIADVRALDRTPHGLYVACANTLQRVISEAVGIATDWGIALELFDKAGEMEAGDPAFDNPNAGDDNGGDWIEQAK